MHPHESLITRFYSAFAARDPAGMARCYHPEILFTDPVFPSLKGAEASAMWAMLDAKTKDFWLNFSEVHADDEQGSAHWEVQYFFSKTGRPVCNKIKSSFKFKDGLIVRHIDTFDFWMWASQALGAKGLLLGWCPPVRSMVRREAKKGLECFREALLYKRA